MIYTAETCQLSSRWLNKSNDSGRVASPVEKHIFGETKSENPSPRTVLDELEGESNTTEDDTFSVEDSSISQSPPQAPKPKGLSNTRMRMSPGKFFTSILSSPLRKRNGSLSNKEKHQPLLTCFSYEEISSATNNFHSGNKETKFPMTKCYALLVKFNFKLVAWMFRKYGGSRRVLRSV